MVTDTADRIRGPESVRMSQMAAEGINDLLDQLIESWSGWDTSRAFYLETLAPAIVRDDQSVANLTPHERRLIDSLRKLLTKEAWRNLPQLLANREAHLREVRSLREEEARLRPIRNREERKRLRAEHEQLERQRAMEREQQKEQQLQELQEQRRRRHALIDRILGRFESDFLGADATYRHDADRNLLSSDQFESMKAEFVKAWVRRELDLVLDDEQAAVIASIGGDVRVTARAGSGKTRTLVTRAIFLCRHCGVDPRTMLLLAFNRRAAQEMRERLEAAFGGEIPHVMTFHALAHALVHPEEALVYDDPVGDAPALSRVIQDVIDEHIDSGLHAATIRRIMLMHFREDCHPNGVDELERRRAHRRETLGGEFVKSYGEKLIANTLFEHSVTYEYEPNHRWGGVNYRPDFTIPDPEGGGLVIEYLGLQGDPEYDKQSQEKRKYWIAKPEWKLLEYFPPDIAVGNEAFTTRLVADLGAHGVHVERLAEEEIWELVRGRAIDRFTRVVRTFVTRCRKRGLTNAQLETLSKSHVPLTSAEEEFLGVGKSIHRRYVERLADAGQEDFDGLMWRAIELLRANHTTFARKKGHEHGDVRQLRYVLIDEFQDFSQMFFELISEVRAVAKDVEFFCVGDDWQAINSFAGSDLTYFLSFDRYFDGGTSGQLSTNYRSVGNVVAAGNAVMAGRGSPAVTGRVGEGIVWVCDLGRLDPTAIEINRHGGDEITPAALRLVQHLLSLEQDVVLLSRERRIPWYVNYGREYDHIPDALERFLAHIRSYLPEDDRKRVSISTAHGYKGLEQAAVVILDATEGSYPLIHPSWVFLRVFGDTLNRIEHEERRLFYVAVTRAAISLCLVTEKHRYSPYLQDLERLCELEFAPWQELPPYPSLDVSRIEICVFDAFDVKADLRRLGFRWNPKQKYWSRTYPADSFSEEKLIAKSWYRGTVQVEVRSEQGKVIRPRSHNGSII